MPFVTEYGGLELAHDVIPPKRDKDTGELIVEGNGLKKIALAEGMNCDYNPNSKYFKEIVRRGNADFKEKMWIRGENPVWRIPTNRMNEETLKRVFEFFKKNKTQPTIQIHYEPDLEDIEVKSYGKTKDFHFPLWLIEELMAMSEFTLGLKVSKVAVPAEKKLDQETYDAIMSAIEERKLIDSDVLKAKAAEEHAKKEDALKALEDKQKGAKVPEAKTTILKGADRQKKLDEAIGEVFA